MRPSARLLVCSLFVSTQLWPAAASVTPPLPPPRPADLVVAAPSVEPPQPPPRPLDFTQPAPPATPAPPPASSPASVENPEDPAACDQLLSSGAVTAKRLPPIGGENGCGIAAPVSLEAVILPDKRAIRLEPSLTLRCDFAATAVRWIATDLVPSIEASATASSGRVARIAGAGGYQCRPRNGQAGAFLSEHARGNAMDIDTIERAVRGLRGRINVSIGWGTNLTNDFKGCATDGVDGELKAISIVCKVADVEGRPAVKLSDNPNKVLGPPEEIARYRRVFGASGMVPQPVLV